MTKNDIVLQFEICKMMRVTRIERCSEYKKKRVSLDEMVIIINEKINWI